jgi:simple sugar transport system substrate-binding protein
MKSRKVFTALFALLLVVGVCTSYATGAGEKPKSGGKEYVIYVVVHGGISHPFWKVVERGAEDVDALLPDLKVVYTGPDVYNFEQFMSIVDSSIAAKPDGLILTITSPEAMDQQLRRVIDQLKIPVIAINAKDPRSIDKRIPYLSYVGESSYDVGVSMAREALKRIRPKRAVFGNHAPGAIPIEERAAGFRDTIKAAGIPVDILDVTADPVKGAVILMDYLKAHPDTQLVYPSATPHIEAFIPLAESEGIKIGKDVFVTSIDISPKVLEFIEQDKVMFTIDQQQYMQGSASVYMMYLHLKYGLTPPALIPTGPGIITKDKVKQLNELSKQGIR